MKTLKQISDQTYNLYYTLIEMGNTVRANKVIRIKFRYNDNINNLPEQQKLIERGYRGDWYVKRQTEEKRCNIAYTREIYAK